MAPGDEISQTSLTAGEEEMQQEIDLYVPEADKIRHLLKDDPTNAEMKLLLSEIIETIDALRTGIEQLKEARLLEHERLLQRNTKGQSYPTKGHWERADDIGDQSSKVGRDLPEIQGVVLDSGKRFYPVHSSVSGDMNAGKHSSVSESGDRKGSVAGRSQRTSYYDTMSSSIDDNKKDSFGSEIGTQLRRDLESSFGVEGRTCVILHGGMWVNAVVKSQTSSSCFVQIIGNSQKNAPENFAGVGIPSTSTDGVHLVQLPVHSVLGNTIPKVDPSVAINTRVQCIYYGDGLWYDAILKKKIYARGPSQEPIISDNGKKLRNSSRYMDPRDQRSPGSVPSGNGTTIKDLNPGDVDEVTGYLVSFEDDETLVVQPDQIRLRKSNDGLLLSDAKKLKEYTTPSGYKIPEKYRIKQGEVKSTYDFKRRKIKEYMWEQRHEIKDSQMQVRQNEWKNFRQKLSRKDQRHLDNRFTKFEPR